MIRTVLRTWSAHLTDPTHELLGANEGEHTPTVEYTDYDDNVQVIIRLFRFTGHEESVTLDIDKEDLQRFLAGEDE